MELAVELTARETATVTATATVTVAVMDGCERLTFHRTPATGSSNGDTAGSVAVSPATGTSPDWLEIQTLELDTAGPPTRPVGSADAGSSEPVSVERFQNRRLALRAATLVTSVGQLQEALNRCPLGEEGVADLRVWMEPGGPRLAGRFSLANREAPFTIRVAIEVRTDGRRRLRISFADVRLYGPIPVPAPMVGVAMARAIKNGAMRAGASVRLLGATIELDPLELALVSSLVARGWRLPDLRRGWLQSVIHSGDDVRLNFGSEGHPTERFTTLEPLAPAALPLATLEGERLADPLAAAEDLLFAGDHSGAERAYREVLAGNPADRAARTRLLSLRAAANGSDVAALAEVLMAEWPGYLPGVLYAATAAVAAGETLRAVQLFHDVAALAESRAEAEDAALARAAARSLSAESEKTTTTTTMTTSGSVAIDDERQADPRLTALTDAAIARGDLVAADALFVERIDAAADEQQAAVLTAERARVQLLGPDGAWRALNTLRQLSLAATPEEGLILRADLAVRVDEPADARETLDELITRAVAAGDVVRARELAAHQAELAGPPPAGRVVPPTASTEGIPRAMPVDESSNITAKTAAVYAESDDPTSRDEALGDLLQGFERLTPDRQHDAYASFGRVAESTGDLDHAEEAYWRATGVASDPNRRADDLTAHARVLLSRGNTAAALVELEEALALSPEHAAALALLADHAFQAREWDRARQLYGRLAGAPDVADVITRDVLLLRHAVLARAGGDLGEAERCYQELAILNPRDVEVRRALAQLALERHDVSGAASRLEEVLHLLPLDAVGSLVDVRQNLGELYFGLGDWKTARYYLELVLSHDPAHVPTLERLVDVYERLGLDPEAVDALARLARRHSQPRKRAEALLRQGDILRQRMGDEARAFDSYLKSSDLDPTFPPTALRLIAGFWAEGRFQEVAATADDLLRAGPLPEIDDPLRLRLAVAFALARGDATRAAEMAELTRANWNATTAAMVLTETAGHLSGRPPHELEPAVSLLELWRSMGTTGTSGDAAEAGVAIELWPVLRAQALEDPAVPGLAHAVGWIAERAGDGAMAGVFLSIATFIEEDDEAGTKHDLSQARDTLARWDAFRAIVVGVGAGAAAGTVVTAAEPSVVDAGRDILAALRALLRVEEAAADAVRPARPALTLTGRERRIELIRTPRGRELLRFAASDSYARALAGADAGA